MDIIDKQSSEFDDIECKLELERVTAHAKILQEFIQEMYEWKRLKDYQMMSLELSEAMDYIERFNSTSNLSD